MRVTGMSRGASTPLSVNGTRDAEIRIDTSTNRMNSVGSAMTNSAWDTMKANNTNMAYSPKIRPRLWLVAAAFSQLSATRPNTA